MLLGPARCHRIRMPLCALCVAFALSANVSIAQPLVVNADEFFDAAVDMKQIRALIVRTKN